MLERIIDCSVNNRLMVLLLLLLALAAASYSLPRLNLDAFPDVTNVQVSVNTEAPGLAAEEIEQLITYPIEAVMYALPDVEQVRSISKTGLSGITVVFKEGTDIYFARQLVFERLQEAKDLIPPGVGVPEMGPNTSGLGQVFQYLLIADDKSQFDATALRSLNDWVVKLLLMPVDGITDVLSFGGNVRQYQVNFDPARLLAYGVSQQDLVTAIEQNNQNAGGWFINRGQEQWVIRGTGWFSSGEHGLQQIRQVPVKTFDGVVITVADLATIELGAEIRQGAVTMTRKEMTRKSITHKDSQAKVSHLGEVVSGIVLKRLGANTQETIDAIKQKARVINQALPDGVRFEPFYDQADLIQQSISTVVKALGLAFIFISVVLALFLMNLPATILVLISIPISIAMALTLMTWLGLSANLMSLGGIAVAIGLLVDGSVVMVENIIKKLQVDGGAGQNTTTAIIAQACKDVARPVFFATAIILLVFAPLFSFEGVEAKLFQPMAISIMLAVVSAIIVALTVVPAMAIFLFKANVKVRPNTLLSSIAKVYQQTLNIAIKNNKKVCFVAAILLLTALFLLPRIGTEFVPELEEGTLNLRVTLAPSASLETALSVAPKLEARLMAFPEVTYALSRIGRPEIGGDPEPVNNIEIYIGLKPVAQWTSASNRYELQSIMQRELEQFPGLLFNFSQPIATRVDELLSGVKAQLAIKLFGPDLQTLAAKGQEIESLIKAIDGAQDVALEQTVGEAQLVIAPDRRELSRYGLSVSDIMAVVSDGIGGKAAGQIFNGNERYDIYVRLEQSYRANSEAIADIRLLSPTGAWVRLGDVASITFESGPPQIRRDNVQRRIVIQANVQGRDMGSVVKDIQHSIDTKLTLPPGYSVEIAGQYESQQRAQKRLLLVVPLALVLIALLLYLAFGSVGQAFLILLNVPLAIIGGIFSLYLSGQYLSVPGSVGFITLFGVAVLNGVVLVESINQRIAKGEAVEIAIIEGSTSRLRPVLMTAMTSALGLIPMLLATGTGAEIQKPLASVIVGGLFTATFLTLFVLPGLYRVFSKSKIERLTAH
ncbi:efflux RND transporter permease subunit [Planctobacterium marinum]|uniref:Cytochrome-c peroxidase n=1 Tax=Planctobacterium marinum TaxID=1631968 RepID=A0AA48HHG1_9ALTE|nr:cytochrome-c peroxidase [Planctobacterium marinum]